jgi:hypothetical protein
MGQPFVVQLPNRPGELAHLAKALCARGINIVQIQGSSAAGELGCALIYTDCCEEDTGEVLRSMGYSFVMGSTLLVEVEDTPCALGALTEQLAEGGVNVTGYCKIGARDGFATWSLSTTNEEVAREILGMPEINHSLAGAQ